MLWIAVAVLLMPAARAQDTDSYECYGRGLTPQESRGRDTWYFWTAGGERMWRQITKITGGTVDLLLYAESAPRATRFKALGTINDPDCHAAEHPDQYGFHLDVCKPLVIDGIPGESMGVMGLRKFPNPDFKPELWDVNTYRAHPDRIEPPYIV